MYFCLNIYSLDEKKKTVKRNLALNGYASSIFNLSHHIDIQFIVRSPFRSIHRSQRHCRCLWVPLRWASCKGLLMFQRMLFGNLGTPIGCGSNRCGIHSFQLVKCQESLWWKFKIEILKQQSTYHIVNSTELPAPIGSIQKRSMIEAIVIGTVRFRMIWWC